MSNVLDPSPSRGLQTPLVLAPPRSIPDLGPADDLSSRPIDSYLLRGKYSTSPPHLAHFWLHDVFLTDPTHPSESLISACSLARRWLLDNLNQIDDLPTRVKNIIGCELVHQSR
jgi:hypothetical protein